jgi:hypothetical protein
MWFLFYAAFFLVLSLPLIVAIAVLGVLVRKLQFSARVAILVVSATLLLTPSMGPATITFVPVPFGYLLGITAATGAWTHVLDMVYLFPKWHAVAFPATAVLSYFLLRWVLSNNRFERSRGASSMSQGRNR